LEAIQAGGGGFPPSEKGEALEREKSFNLTEIDCIEHILTMIDTGTVYVESGSLKMVLDHDAIEMLRAHYLAVLKNAIRMTGKT